MKIGINGRFYAARVTGVQRYAIEVTRRIVAETGATLLVPANTPGDSLPSGAHVMRGRLSAHAWEQIELPSMARAAGCQTVLHLAGTAPMSCDNDTVVIHDVLPLTHPQWFSRSFRIWRRTVLQRVASRAARIITVSNWARDEISRELMVPADRISVTTQGIQPFDGPADEQSIARVRARFGLKGPFVLAVGAGDPRKNLQFLSVVGDLWRQEVGDDLEIVAVGAPQAHWFPRTEQRQLRSLGHVDDDTLHALYTTAATLCFPSLAEGFGRPPIEAMACGTPAIVGNYAVAEEAVNGFARVLPFDAAAWVAALRETTRERVRDDVRAELCARYDWDKTAAQVIEACAACA